MYVNDKNFDGVQTFLSASIQVVGKIASIWKERPIRLATPDSIFLSTSGQECPRSTVSDHIH
jgi:hypothetical protein